MTVNWPLALTFKITCLIRNQRASYLHKRTFWFISYFSHTYSHRHWHTHTTICFTWTINVANPFFWRCQMGNHKVANTAIGLKDFAKDYVYIHITNKAFGDNWFTFHLCFFWLWVLLHETLLKTSGHFELWRCLVCRWKFCYGKDRSW